MEQEPHDEFWHPKTVEQLAAAQGVRGPQSLDALIGAGAELWENDEAFERFLASIDRSRREATPA